MIKLLLLGFFLLCVRILFMLILYFFLVKVLVEYLMWNFKGLIVSGWILEINSILGFFFYISVLLDILFFGEFNVR